VRAAQALRFQVFNIELSEGLEESFATGLDADPFDAVCDHLIVQEGGSGEVVGTYRLQPGRRAATELGYYSAQEFDLTPFEPLRRELVELGRACVSIRHRNLFVIQLLWRGIAFYARALGARYLLGCSSLNGTDPRLGSSVYARLSKAHLAPPALQTQPLPGLALPAEAPNEQPAEIPRLLSAYLTLGAVICGPPAVDRKFGSTDFLTLIDLQNLAPQVAGRYLNSLPDLLSALEAVV
jgi:putative hemolysin